MGGISQENLENGASDPWRALSLDSHSGASILVRPSLLKAFLLRTSLTPQMRKSNSDTAPFNRIGRWSIGMNFDI